MNTVLAAIVFYLFLGLTNFRTEIPLVFDHHFFAVNQVNKTDLVIGQVSPDSPASKADIKLPAKIISVNGQTMKTAEEFTGVINENKGKEITLALQDINTFADYKIKLTPRVNPPKNEGRLGIVFSPFQTAVLSYETPSQKLFSGLTYSFNLLDYNMEVIAKLIGVSFQERTAAPVGEAVSGPVGILGVFGQVLQIPNAKEKVLQGLNLIGLISISLAFFNVLPFPALDGGRLFFILIEAVIGRRIKPRIELLANQIGMAILLGLIVLVTINDLLRLFH